MHYSTQTPGSHELPWNPFKSCCIPRPIGWISTISSDGVPNLAPYSQFQNVTWDPPMVMFAANRNETGARKDTVANAENYGWFNWNMATWDLRDAVMTTSRPALPHEDEFELAGLTTKNAIDSEIPLVADSPCHFECRYLQTISIPGDTPEGSVDIVLGRVTRVHVADGLITDEGKLDVLRMKPIARLGYMDYTVVDNIFDMPTQQSRLPAGITGVAE
ncbi:flavin reductase family protein [Rhodococcus sp. H29-C3]|uniref:flavin reductase family protein n=1 Tax=Rhodococcus sp. H29-C3 TaxID=3046307 RepID=UPI0024BA18D2|nr:flavin reductase family protein [Rhodococcus sp. H29-C3]MDJ0361875.1 flavin reductase family protein [Rhodococcus sp. H29-C3]